MLAESALSRLLPSGSIPGLCVHTKLSIKLTNLCLVDTSSSCNVRMFYIGSITQPSHTMYVRATSMLPFETVPII